MNLELLAAFSGVIASAAYFPEALKLYRNKSAHDISLVTFGIWTAYSVIWLAYGVYLGILPIILTYTVAVAGVVTVMSLSIYYKLRR